MIRSHRCIEEWKPPGDSQPWIAMTDEYRVKNGWMCYENGTRILPVGHLSFIYTDPPPKCVHFDKGICCVDGESCTHTFEGAYQKIKEAGPAFGDDLETHKPERFVIMVGNPLDGIDIYGPFSSVEDADEMVNRHLSSSHEWWLVRIHERP